MHPPIGAYRPSGCS